MIFMKQLKSAKSSVNTKNDAVSMFNAIKLRVCYATMMIYRRKIKSIVF